MSEFKKELVGFSIFLCFMFLAFLLTESDEKTVKSEKPKDTLHINLPELTQTFYQVMETRERNWELRELVLQGEISALLDTITKLKEREPCE